MRKNEDKRTKDRGMLKSLAIGTLVGFLVILIIFALAALLISGEKIGQGIGEEAMLVSAFIGSFAGGLTAARKSAGKKVLAGVGVGAVFLALRLLLGAFGTCDIIEITTGTFAVCALGGGLCGGLASGHKKKKRRHHNKT